MSIDNEIREQIIEKARIIFAQYGLKKSTMDEIAQAVYKAKSSIYYYFKSKEEIFQAVLEREGDIMKQELIDSISRETDPRRKIHAYVLTRMQLFNKLGNFYSTFQSEFLDNFTFIEKLRKKYDQNEVLMISAILSEGIKNGEFEVKDLEMATMSIILALKGFEYPWSIQTDQKKLSQDIDTLLDILFNGILKR
ncbi:MAG: TetR/AcrR family transcriptional regulator [Bacteroidota bacterium]